MTSLRQRLRNWLEASIGNRVSALLLSLTLGFMLVAGAANFAYLLYMTRQATAAALAEDARDAANDLTQVLHGIMDDNRLLAGNPTILSAVLDARDQETYLYPLLSRFRPLGRTPDMLCVTDYTGRSIGCSKPARRAFPNQRWLAQAIEDNRPAAQFMAETPNKPVMYLVYPVAYEGTGQAEGAVVAEYDLTTLLLDRIAPPGRYTHLHIETRGQELFYSGQHEKTIQTERKLDLDGALAPLELSLGLGVTESSFNTPQQRLILAYGLLALLLACLAWWTARRAVPPLIARLTTITREANRVAAGEQMIFDGTVSGRDELAQLANSFSTMTMRLHEINQSLEYKVKVRTEALRQQEELLHSIMNAVPGAIFQFRLRPDGSTHTPFVSHALTDIYGARTDQIRDDATPLFASVHPEDIAAHSESIRHSAQTLSQWQHDFRVVRPDGAITWLHVNAVPQQETDGSVLWHGIITDITEHKRAELALADSEAYSKALFKHSYIPLLIMNPDTEVFVDCNDAAVAIYGVDRREDILGKGMPSLSPPTQYDGSLSPRAASSHIDIARKDGVHMFDWRHLRPSAELWDAEVRLTSFRHSGQEFLQFSLRDITEQNRSAAEIWHKANFDTLTKLPNRSLCLDRLERSMAQARRSGSKVGILFIDLDGFKGINDTLGHAAGDDMLYQVARRLERCVREQDTAARFGGDEFILIVESLGGYQDLRRVAEEALTLLHQPFTISGETRQISGSIGIAVFPDDANSPEALLSYADQALYGSKRAGKNRFGFHGTTA